MTSKWRLTKEVSTLQEQTPGYFASAAVIVKYGGRSPKFSLGSMSRYEHSCTHWLRPRSSPPPLPNYEGAICQQRQTTSLVTPWQRWNAPLCTHSTDLANVFPIMFTQCTDTGLKALSHLFMTHHGMHSQKTDFHPDIDIRKNSKKSSHQ